MNAAPAVAVPKAQPQGPLAGMRSGLHQTNKLLANPMENLSRQVRIGHGTAEIDRSEQSAQNKQRTAALITALARWKQGA